MLILISINVQCLQNVVFSFEKGSNSQDHSSSDSQNPIKNFLCSKIFNCPHLREFPTTSKHYLVKNWISHWHQKRIFWKKWLRLKLPLSTYCVPSCLKNSYSISWLKKPYSISRNTRLNNFEANWTQIYHMPKKVLFGVARLFYH